MAERITILGTGSAFVTRCYNTCFIIDCGVSRLMVDAGGGNGILTQLEKAGVAIADVGHLFLTHAHTDHVIGAVWVARAVVNAVKKQAYDGALHIYGHKRVINVLTEICRLTFSKKDFDIFQERIAIDVLTDGCQRKIAGMDITFFSLHSTKEEQYGFRAVTPEGKTVVCLGDEPLNDANRDVAQNADWLLTEAFCLHSEAERYKPYEKHHSTALDAGKTAATLHARNLIIYHTEDDSLPSRQKAYAAEAALNFSGHIVVPNDLDSVTLYPLSTRNQRRGQSPRR